MFISYAQNFEDVYLFRALKSIEKGFYIDIGAQDPVIDSVSMAFHEKGWKGIHVEPTPHYAMALADNRPGDMVIQAAISDSRGIIEFFEIPESGLSTGDKEIADSHKEKGFKVNKIQVKTIKLSTLFDLVPIGQDVHWMKIDVEGFEKNVISSWGENPMRPWILVIESTLPLTNTLTFETFEPLLYQLGYNPVYFDNLNRYYVHESHNEICDTFTSKVKK